MWRSRAAPEQTLAEMLRARVRLQTIRLRLILVSEILLTIVVLGLAAAALPRMTASGALRASIVVLLYTGGVWAFALWNRRGVWQSYGKSLTDCISLLRLRAERRVRSAWFCVVVIAAATLVMRRQITSAFKSGIVGEWEQWVWFAFGVYSIILVAWSAWYLGRARKELRELEVVERSMTME
jgi:hypothetical protein